eukprot:239030-Amphidinium_carterae.1
MHFTPAQNTSDPISGLAVTCSSTDHCEYLIRFSAQFLGRLETPPQPHEVLELTNDKGETALACAASCGSMACNQDTQELRFH